MSERSRPEKLAELLGGKSELARVAEVSPSLVSRWCKRGAINPAYNTRIKRFLFDKSQGMAALEASEFMRQALACLEAQDVCKCCGQPIDGRRAI